MTPWTPTSPGPTAKVRAHYSTTPERAAKIDALLPPGVSLSAAIDAAIDEMLFNAEYGMADGIAVTLKDAELDRRATPTEPR